MTRVGILILFIFLIGFVSAACNSTQINVNTASATELDKIINVGPATAAKIIANRTYNSLDDLIRVKGIGNITLAEIKAEGLACVTEEETEEEEETPVEEEEETETNTTTTVEVKINVTHTNTSENKYLNSTVNNSPNEEIEDLEEGVELAPIQLNSNSILENSEDIKTENNKENLRKNLPVYGIIAFCAVFGTAFFIRRRKTKHGFE